MKVVGLITEYNPFHKGHLYHLQRSKEITGADYVVVVMSGNYVQRGEPALLDKWTRAKIALSSGADMVIELPVHYSTASAEFFACGAVATLEKTGIVDTICFGSENGDLSTLDTVATVLNEEPAAYKEALEQALNQGLNFPQARSKALNSVMNKNIYDIMNTPNNILGIEYLKALKKLKSSIQPVTIQRMGAGYHDEDVQNLYPSATAIRKYLSQKNDLKKLSSLLPSTSFDFLCKAIQNKVAPVFYQDFYDLLRYKLLITPAQELSKILDVTEGLENRIIACNMESVSIDNLVDRLSTKRYTRTKLNRCLLHALLDIRTETFEVFNHLEYAQYIKVLGFKKDSQILMKRMKQSASVPIIVNVKDSIKKLTSVQRTMLMDEIRSTHIYNTVILGKFGKILKTDYNQPILMMKD